VTTQTTSDSSPDTVVRHGILIDGCGGPPVPDACVHVGGDGVITYAGPEATAPPAPPTAQIVDVAGNAILPGFIDCHVHFCIPGGSADALQALTIPATLNVFRIAERLRVTLENGVTTARDLMGIDQGFRMAVDSGLIPGPRLVLSVTIISSTGGHGDATWPSGLDPMPYLVSPGAFPAHANGADEARAMARKVLQAGADVIKIAATGGVLTPTDRPDDVGFTVEEIAAIVEEAHSRRGGVKVAAHAQGRHGIQNALDGGVDSIEHGYDLQDSQRQQMVDSGVYLVPTLLEVMSELDPSLGPVALAKKALWKGRAQANFPLAIQAGVPIAMGTDCGAGPEHGTNLKELGLLVDNGMTPMQAIQTGTRDAAELCQMSDVVGTLEVGKQADLVIARGNPLTDIHSLGDPDNVLLVLKGGHVAKDRAGFA